MEKVIGLDQKTLLNELTQGKELTEQLNSISSPEMRQNLVDKILNSYQKIFSILNLSVSSIDTKPIISTFESPRSYANSSPRSEISDQDCKDQCARDVYKKRKTQPRWTEQVKVCSGSGMDGPLDDGYSWRKYGQKEILGANFPRSYYRCTHRNSQGCLATKQVQKSDQDTTIFEVTYRGRHTCFQSTRLAFLTNDKSKQDDSDNNCQLEEEPKPKPKPTKELSFNFTTEIKTEEENSERIENIFPSFSFSGAALYIGNENEENDLFKESIMESELLGGLASPSFIFSTTSGQSNYFSCHYNVKTPESESVPNSVTNSPTGDWDLSIHNLEFDTSFLENPESFA